MERLTIFAFAAVVLVAGATEVLWSHSTKLSAGLVTMPSLQELHKTADANRLPNQEIEDQSLVFPNTVKR
jgi:hypothetical protein